MYGGQRKTGSRDRCWKMEVTLPEEVKSIAVLVVVLPTASGFLGIVFIWVKLIRKMVSRVPCMFASFKTTRFPCTGWTKSFRFLGDDWEHYGKSPSAISRLVLFYFLPSCRGRDIRIMAGKTWKKYWMHLLISVVFCIQWGKRSSLWCCFCFLLYGWSPQKGSMLQLKGVLQWSAFHFSSTDTEWSILCGIFCYPLILMWFLFRCVFSCRTKDFLGRQREIYTHWKNFHKNCQKAHIHFWTGAEGVFLFCFE